MNNFDFDWKLVYLLPSMIIKDVKLRVFQYKIQKNILFVNKMLFKLWKLESPLRSKAGDQAYIHLFYKYQKTYILWRQLQEYFSTGLDLPSILPHSAIFRFLDDDLEHNLLLKHILLILFRMEGKVGKKTPLPLLPVFPCIFYKRKN